MATKIRSRFEVDQRELASISIDNCSQRALEEVKRKVKLNRGLARKLRPEDPLPSWNGFESEQRVTKSSLRRRCQLKAADLLAICSFWQAHKPNMPEIAAKFRIIKALAQNLIW